MADAPEEVTPLYGTNGNDILFATYGNWANVVDGLGGDDVIVRDRTGAYWLEGDSFGNVFVYGASGADTVSYTNADHAVSVNLAQGVAELDAVLAGGITFGTDSLESIERVVGTTFGDHIIGSAGVNRLWGHDGDDDIWGEAGSDELWGMQGDDLIYGGTGADKLYGDDGEDDLRGGDHADLLRGADDDDDLRGDDGNDTLHGDDGDDTLRGGDDSDTLYGGEDGDTLYGDGGNDHLHMGPGDDVAFGGSGEDRFYVSGGGDNDLHSGSGADWVQYSGAAPVLVNLWGDAAIHANGADTFDSVENVLTGTGADTVFGTSGYNRVWTGSGNDSVYALGGDDEVRAGSGQDVVVGYGGAETIYGEGGHDHLYGGGGGDAISGSSGQDFIQGGDGDDELWGGSDADTFHFAAADDGVETIHDFNTNQDKLSFGAGYFQGQNLGGFDVSEALWAYAWGGVTSLYADRTGQGLTQIAILDGVGRQRRHLRHRDLGCRWRRPRGFGADHSERSVRSGVGHDSLTTTCWAASGRPGSLRGRAMRLSEREAELIRGSFRVISADPSRAARVFYDHLFEIAPHTRRLFVTDLERQGAKLVATVGFVIAEAEAWVNVAPLVEELALRHLAYGVQPGDYPPVGLALQAMLHATLGAGCTPEVAAAWARVYDALQVQMIDAAYAIPAAEDDAG